MSLRTRERAILSRIYAKFAILGVCDPIPRKTLEIVTLVV